MARLAGTTAALSGHASLAKRLAGLGWLLAGMLASVSCGVAATAPASDPLGDWLVEDRTGIIRIEPCGGTVCGRIVGMTVWPRDGTVPMDLHGKPQCHMIIVHDVSRKEADLWRGEITDPDSGRTYDVRFWVDATDRLHLRGYIGLPLFGATQVWTRYRGAVPADCHMR